MMTFLLNGLDAIRRLKQEGVRAKVLVLTTHVSFTFAARALKAGASGFLLKQSGGEELIQAIQQIM